MFAVDHEAERMRAKGKRKSTIKKSEPIVPKAATVPQENRLYDQAKRAERRKSEQREKVSFLSGFLSGEQPKYL